jgi:hypothetical protein
MDKPVTATSFSEYSKLICNVFLFKAERENKQLGNATVIEKYCTSGGNVGCVGRGEVCLIGLTTTGVVEEGLNSFAEFVGCMVVVLKTENYN